MTEAFFLFFPFLFGLIPYLSEKNLYFEYTLETYLAGLLLFGLCRNKSLFTLFLVLSTLSLFHSFVGGICLLYAALCIYLSARALRDRDYPGLKLWCTAAGLFLLALILSPFSPPLFQRVFFLLSPFLVSMALLNHQRLIWGGVGVISFLGLFFLSSPGRELSREQADFQSSIASLFSIEHSLEAFPSPGQLRRLCSEKGPSRILVPLPDSVLELDGNHVGFSKAWKFLYPRWNQVYPVFYLFKNHQKYWLMGFRDMKDWRKVLENSPTKMDSPPVKNASLVIGSQVFGYMDFLNHPQLQNTLSSWISTSLPNGFSPTLYWFYSRFQKNRLEAELRASIPDHPYFGRRSQQELISDLIGMGELEVARSLLYRLNHSVSKQKELAHLFASLALSLGDYPAAVAYARDAKHKDPIHKKLLLKALDQWERHYHGYPPFDYSELITLSKELYEESGRLEPFWLWESVRYQEKKMKSFNIEDRVNPWINACGKCSPSKP